MGKCFNRVPMSCNALLKARCNLLESYKDKDLCWLLVRGRAGDGAEYSLGRAASAEIFFYSDYQILLIPLYGNIFGLGMPAGYVNYNGDIFIVLIKSYLFTYTEIYLFQVC